ncbi:MAG TPA: NAD(P)/FAD-dependent oxidoreductase [Limnochordia bacterium]|nr:NAD(P)/FAD-dependent oxidoreductase [Limnochordia bacterium]
MNSQDVIVIGGGPAGLMAAAAAAKAGARTLILEKGDRLGRKLIISGGGRCNVTNRKPLPELLQHIPGNGRFLYGALSRFGPEAIIDFFEGLGIALKEEDHNRMFPVSDRAITVARALIDHLHRLGVETRTGCPVAGLDRAGERCAGVVLADGTRLSAGAVVVACGGASVPKTGSTGDGYAWAEAAGHTLTPLYPAEVPLTSAEPWLRDRSLQGLSLREIVQTLYDPDGKAISRQVGDMVFTHFGLSGPASLRTSHYVAVTQLRRGRRPLRLELDLAPDYDVEALRAALQAQAAEHGKRSLRNLLKALLPERLIDLTLTRAALDGTVTGAHLSRADAERAANWIKAWPVVISGTLPLADAFVTGGGVDVREVDPRTFGSKRLPGLYFAGEVLDLHAHTGGYNITVAFTSGHAAGTAAAAFAAGRVS